MNDVELPKSQHEWLEVHDTIIVPDEAYDAFVRALEESPRVLDRLRELLRQPSPFASETEANDV